MDNNNNASLGTSIHLKGTNSTVLRILILENSMVRKLIKNNTGIKTTMDIEPNKKRKFIKHFFFKLTPANSAEQNTQKNEQNSKYSRQKNDQDGTTRGAQLFIHVLS